VDPKWKASDISVVWRDGAWFVMAGVAPASRHSYRDDAKDAALLAADGRDVLVRGRWGETAVLTPAKLARA
jgi:hypothetical protein